jgi:glycyl-tRNA synthetase
MVMRTHQRYFPLYDASRSLRNAFIAVVNGSPDLDRVRAGNEDVLRARFRDAVFFYKADLRVPLEDFVPRLQGAVFHRDLGSVYDKVQRTAAIVPAVAAELGLEDAAADGKRAVVLGKADQASAMVTEMTALTGIMGKHYAEKQGLPQVRAAHEDVGALDGGVYAGSGDGLACHRVCTRQGAGAASGVWEQPSRRFYLARFLERMS